MEVVSCVSVTGENLVKGNLETAEIESALVPIYPSKL